MRYALANAASLHGGVFTRAEAIEAGYTPRQVRNLLQCGIWTHLRHGILADGQHLATASELDRAILEVAAARLTTAQPTVASDRSAAACHELPLLHHRRTVELVGVRSAQGGTQQQPILVRPAAVPPEDRVELNGVPFTSITRTLADLSVVLPMLEVVMAADHALHRGLTTVEDLVAVAEQTEKLPLLMDALPWLDARSESAFESLSRIILAQQGIDVPELQYEVRDGRGQFVARVDFCWPHRRVIGEADGLGKYTTPEDLRREKLRQERLEQLGYIVVRWTWEEIMQEPAAVATRLRRAFAAAA